MTLIEKILFSHSDNKSVRPGDIIDVFVDIRAARDFGGANVIKIIEENKLSIDDPQRTFFTFDCNPTGSDQKYASNQHKCRIFARNKGIRVFDIDRGIGTHIMIEEGLVIPGSIAVSTDSHANLLGAIGAFGQGMGDLDIAAIFKHGKTWFKVPETVKILLKGKIPADISAKDIVLNLLAEFGPDSMLGYAIEVYCEDEDSLSLDQRITISSMATEMGAIIIFFPPGKKILQYCEATAGRKVSPVRADKNSDYSNIIEKDISKFRSMVSLPGKPHQAVPVESLVRIKIDSSFIGSCTNGRLEDMRAASRILKSGKVAPGVVLKIVPATDLVWRQCLDEGLIDVFKKAGALVSNAGCAGCAAGQVGQNGPGETTISTGNRNFTGKQGQGDVFLGSPEIAAASAIAGFITTPSKIPSKPAVFKYSPANLKDQPVKYVKKSSRKKPEVISGKCCIINRDNIDTDMIFHNRFLTITDSKEMGQYTFSNLEGYQDFAKQSHENNIIFTGKNFGSGSSRQQAVDCFIALGIQCIVAGSFGAIYERNAINAGFPVLCCPDREQLQLEEGDLIEIDLSAGLIKNITKNKSLECEGFSDVQMALYQNNGII